jgi:acetylornithine deacetylase/succinyl-diaminopimelate desuccinylase family protein
MEAGSSIDPERLRSLLVALIAADSTNPPGGEAAVVALLAAQFERHGLHPEITEALPGRPNLSVSIGAGSGPVLLLNAHTDTMPAGQGWTRPPFGAVVEGGLVYGRGACDAKGGLAAFVEAVIAIAESGGLRGRVILDCVADEEAGAAGTKAAVAAGRKADWAIVAEPTDLAVARLSNGQLDVAVTFRGRAAHGSTPDDGISAIAGAAELVGMVEAAHARFRATPYPLLGPATYNVGTIRGGVQASIVPAACVIEIDRRILPGSTVESAIADVDALLADLRSRRHGLEIDREVTVAIPPVVVVESSPVCTALAAALVESGSPAVMTGLRATSDAAWLDRAGIPAVVFGPGSLAHAHRPDEHVKVADVVTAARVIEAVARRLVG